MLHMSQVTEMDIVLFDFDSRIWAVCENFCFVLPDITILFGIFCVISLKEFYIQSFKVYGLESHLYLLQKLFLVFVEKLYRNFVCKIMKLKCENKCFLRLIPKNRTEKRKRWRTSYIQWHEYCHKVTWVFVCSNMKFCL